MATIRSAISDSLITSMWVFSVSSLGFLTYLLSSYLSIQPRSLPGLFITTLILTVLILSFSMLSGLLGGASFNPTSTVASSAAGLRPTSLFSFAVSFPAQAFGGILGAKVVSHVMPSEYKFLLRGPSLKVDLQTGALAEGLLTFVISFAILVILTKGPRSMFLRVYMVAMVTLGLVVLGSGYTGPAMNPANAYGWAYMNDKHNSWEQLCVYWICPFIGSGLAGWIYKFVFPLQKPKQKKA